MRKLCGKAGSSQILLSVFLLLFCLSPISTSADTGFEPPIAQFGEPLSGEAIERLPKHVFATGDGLPAGQGTAAEGAQLYAQQCASCHGSQGQGGRALELVGDRSLLNTEYPDKGIAVYWPNAPTLFEYVYRSMPPEKPASLRPDEMYALVAYLLQLNELLPEGSTLDAEKLSSIVMPNQSGFVTVAE
jgi:cytochrome c